MSTAFQGVIVQYMKEGINITNLFQIPIQNRRFDTYYRSMLLQTNESKSNNGAVLCCLQHTV